MLNYISGVVVAFSVEDCWFENQSPGQLKQKTKKLIFATSPLSMQALRSKSKDWLIRIRIMSIHVCVLSGETCLTADCCFSETALRV